MTEKHHIFKAISFRALIVSAVLLVVGSRSVQLEASTVEGCASAPEACAAVDSDTLAAATSDSTGRRPWIAAAEIAGVNLGLLAFDRYVLNGPYAHVTLRTLKRNFEMTHWWWDVDKFFTNLLEHPYHGNLYYNAARSNGMGFAASSLFTAGGSLMWELAGENELPSINDLLATSLGGVAIGEVTFRLSDMILDPHKRGAKRVFTELAAAVVNPMRGFNRLLTGEAWQVSAAASELLRPSAFEASVAAGVRHVDASGGRLTTPFVEVDMEYGNATEQGHCKPYDYFRAGLTLAAASGQNLESDARIVGRILQRPLHESEGLESAVGLYQHFSYYDTSRLSSGDLPYKLSEALSLGPGLTFSLPHVLPSVSLRQAFFANGVVLGGAGDDHPHAADYRDYSFGSGFNLKTSTRLSVGQWGRLWIDVEDHHLYTWVGYDDMERDNRTYAQGHRGHHEVLMVRSVAEMNMRNGWGLRLGASYFYRNNRYAVLPDRKAHTWEWRAGLLWRL